MNVNAWPFVLALLLALGLVGCVSGTPSPSPVRPTPGATGSGGAVGGPLPGSPTLPLTTPAGSSGGTPPAPSGPTALSSVGPKIALLLSAGRAGDAYGKAFVDAARALTATVIFNSAGNAAEQQSQAQDALAQGARALVIQPADPQQAAALVGAAHQAGAKVIAFERMIDSPDLDLYITYDYRKVGRLQAQAALDWLSAQAVKPPYNLALLEGAAGDPVAATITFGYYDVLNPHIDKLEVKIIADVAHDHWSADQAFKTTQEVLSGANGNLQAILANNSAMARGALQALAQQKLAGRAAVFVAGADADLQNVQAVCGGAQAFDVYKPGDLLARRAAEAAVRLANGATVKQVAQALPDVALLQATASQKPVPLLGVDVKPITLDSVQADLVQSGVYTENQVGRCIPPPAPGASVPQVAAGARGTIVLWTQEDEPRGVYQYLANLAAQFADVNRGAQVSVVQQAAPGLAARFRAAASAGAAPDLLWLGNDASDPLALADLLQPADSLIDPLLFIDPANAAVVQNGQHWGVPLSLGHELLLFYNKRLLKTPPADSDALLKLAPILSKPDGSRWALAYDQSDPAFVALWLAGFKGKAIADDGNTATLDTPAMVDTLTWLKALKDKRVARPDTDSATAGQLFKQGQAALIIAYDSSLPDYAAALGSNLGAARILPIAATGAWPAPYASGRFLLFSKNSAGDRLELARAFAQFLTSRAIQLDMLRRFQRMPALKEALADPLVAGDPLLKAQADQLLTSLPQPANATLGCIDESIRANLPLVLSGKVTPADAAKAMQDAADACLAK